MAFYTDITSSKCSRRKQCMNIRYGLLVVFLMMAGSIYWLTPYVSVKHQNDHHVWHTPSKKPLTASPAQKQQEAPQGKSRFVRLDPTSLPTNDNRWSCVKDNQNNIIWEVKTKDGGWQDHQFTYSWYNEATGIKDGGSCLYAFCDTQGYVQHANEKRLCGVNHWRLPTEQELRSLDHESAYFPDIDVRYFPNTTSAGYWSNTQSPSNTKLALMVDFSNNIGYLVEKRMEQHIRIVSDVPP